MKLHYSKVSNTVLDIKPDKRTEVFNFGEDNAFPSLVKALTDMSVTAKNCVNQVAKAIYGKSFGKVGKRKVNRKGQSLNEVLRIAAREYAEENNCYLQIGFDGNYDFKSIKVIPATHVRIGKADDLGYSGKFIVYDNWDKSKGKKIMSEGFTIVDRFNPNKKVIASQVEKSGGIENYNGQIVHIKKDDVNVYSLSDLYPVLNEALLEASSQIFRSNGALKGFLNTKLLAVQPFGSDEERKHFKRDLKEVRGAENSSEVVLLESAQPSEDLSKQMYLGDLSSPYNDKLFEYSDSQAEKNICKAFLVPLLLVNPTDNGLFGNSGEAFREAKQQLYESREEDRDQLEEVFSMLMSKWNDKPIEGLKIVSPFEEAEEVAEGEETPTDVNAEAQANLRGSVGGVTALLAIQQSVGLGTTTRDAGVSMIVNIFGFDEDTASEMIGDPKPMNKKTSTEV